MPDRPSLWWRTRHAWSVRVVWLALRRDPRCRASDRLEAAAVVTVAAVVTAALCVAIVLGVAMTSSSVALAHQQQLDRRTASALVVASSTDHSNAAYPAISEVTLTWSSPRGTLLHDTTRVSGVPAVGTHLTIWIDHDGRRVDAPMTVLQGVLRSWMLVFVALSVVVLLCFGLLAATRQALMQARLRGWDAEWIQIGSGRFA